MRTVTLVAIVVMTSVLALWGCDKDNGGESGETEAASGRLPPEPNYYETAHLSPQERLDRDMRGMYDGTVAYFLEERTSADGGVTHMMPGSAPLTPATVPCGEAVAVESVDWSHPTWRAIHFPPDHPFRYSFEYTSQGTGEGASFRITAYGDLDCDGVLSTFVRHGRGLRGGRIDGTMESEITNGDE
jgi:hypothetical protein